MEYTDIRYSDITTCIDLWVPEQHNWRTDGLQMNCGEGEQSHAYIINTQLKHNWLLVMEYTHIRYSDITTCIDSVSARAAQLEDGWSPNELCEGEQSHAYIIKHPIETQLNSLWWNTLTSGTVTLLRVLILWVPEQHNWRTDGSPNELYEESSLCLHNQHPLKHNLTSAMEPSVLQLCCSGTHRINTVVMSLYLMWVYSITRSQLCFNWVLDYVSMRLLSLTQFIWRPIRPPVVLLWHSQNQYTYNVTVPWCECIPSQGVQLCFNWVLDYVSMRLLSSHNSFGDHPSLQLCCSGTHRINTRSMSLTWCQCIPSQKSIVFQLGAWLCKHELLSPTQFIWRPSVPQLCCSGTHRINTLRNVTVPDWVYSITRSQLCFNWCLIM